MPILQIKKKKMQMSVQYHNDGPLNTFPRLTMGNYFLIHTFNLFIYLTNVEILMRQCQGID